jgi:hypothetical protein
MKIRLILGVTMALAFVSLSASTAQADGLCGCRNYSIYTQDRIPYFAQHPPVYYSYVVPRPYGYSPYAYPGTVMTPERAPQAKPATIINPFVRRKADSPAPKTASTTGRRAQVIHPTALRAAP